MKKFLIANLLHWTISEVVIMEKKVLIAIDLSENSLKAVDYVGEMMVHHPSVSVTLLNIIREPSSDVMPDEIERKAYVRKMRDNTGRHMEEAARRLINTGIDEKNIQVKMQVCSKLVSIADLILKEAREGHYQTVVVGRRGVSKRQEFLFGSISKKVVGEAKDCAVWVIE